MDVVYFTDEIYGFEWIRHLSKYLEYLFMPDLNQ